MPSQSKQKRLRARINKQLMNYPLARDPRTHQHWRRSEPTGKWWRCELPGDERIEFQLRGDIKDRLRRCPTPLDVNVLLLVLARAEQMERRQINFSSHSAMLRALKVGIDGNTRRHLHDALRYWQELTIRYEGCWYDVGTGERITRQLPPPLQSVSKQGHRVDIVLDAEWFALRRRYWKEVPLPLPSSAAAQNLVLLLACWREPFATAGDGEEPLRGYRTEARTVETDCRKIGLTHSARRAQFRRLLADRSPLRAYYRDKGENLTVIEKPPGKVTFFWTKTERAPPSEPAAPRVRLQPPNQNKPRVERVRRDEPRKLALLEGQLVPAYDEDGRKEMMWERADGELVALQDLTDEERAQVRQRFQL